MSIYLETIKEVRELVKREELLYVDDVTTYLNRCTEFDSVAEGSYSEVYDHPDEQDKVVKVCTDSKDGYYIFARWCMLSENKDNPHIPLIHHEDIIEFHNGKVVRFFVLERLEDITDDGKPAVQPEQFHDERFGVLSGSLRRVELSFSVNQTQFSHEIKNLDEFVDQIKQSGLHLFYNSNHHNQPVDDEIIHEHEEFIKTLFDILTFISPIGMMDLHGDNYMLRGDTVVITDPIGYKYSE